MFGTRNLKWLISLIVILILTTAANAIAAANTPVPVSKVGDGSGVISGYAISNVHYVLNATPLTIDSVTFTLNTEPVAGSAIKIKLVSAGSTWHNCTNVTTAVTCATSGATVESVDELRVIVAD